MSTQESQPTTERPSVNVTVAEPGEDYPVLTIDLSQEPRRTNSEA